MNLGHQTWCRVSRNLERASGISKTGFVRRGFGERKDARHIRGNKVVWRGGEKEPHKVEGNSPWAITGYVHQPD